MSVSSNQESISENDGKSAFEDVALSNTVEYLKQAFWYAITTDVILPPEIRAAFKIDTVSTLRKAFDIAIKEFENDCG